MKKTLIFLILMTLLSTSVFASFTDEWGEYQDDPTSRGFVHDETGIWNESISYITINNAYTYQPLIFDIDEDGSLEFIIGVGNAVNIYSSAGVIETSISLSGAVTAQPLVTVYGGRDNLVVIHVDGANHNYTSIYYNGSAYVTNATGVITAHNQEQGYRCNDNACYTTNSTQDVCEFNAGKNNGNSCSDTLSQTSGVSGVYDAIPTLSDIDLDGNIEMVFSCDNDGNNNIGLCVYDVTSDNLDTQFSTDGIIDDIDDDMSNPIVYDVDGDGDEEICVSFTSDTGERDVDIHCYQHTGDLFLNYNTQIDTGSFVSNPFIADINNADLVCMLTSRGVGVGLSTHRLIKCVDSSATEIYSESWGDTNDNIEGTVLSVADFNNDGHDDVFSFLGIYDVFNGVELVNYESDMNTSYSRFSLGDVDGDNNIDIVGAGSNNVRIFSSTISNQPPVIDNSYRYGGYGSDIGYTSPICINTTITFSTQETGGVSSGNYDNDLSEDRERLVSNCGLNSNPLLETSNGTFDLANPSFSCFYNQTGIYNLRIYLQDDANPSDFTQYNTESIVLNVINGVSGTDCNVINSVSAGSLEAPTTIAGQDDVTDSVESVVNLMTGANNTIKIIIGIVFVISALIFGFKSTTSVMMAGVIGAVTALVLTFIGFFPIWVAIILIISLVALAIITFNRSNGGS